MIFEHPSGPLSTLYWLANNHIWFWLASVGLFSLLVGSFLNVVIYRLPIILDPVRKKAAGTPFNLSKPASHCPKCKNKIKPWQNIPLFSWLVLGGKCFNCKLPIPWRYPLVELSTGAGSVIIAWICGFTWLAAIGIMGYWLLLTISLIIYDTKSLE